MNDEEAQLARRACGDIPAAYCHVVGVQINGDTGTVWLLTNGPREFEEYEVEFERRGGAWHEGAGHGGFQTGTPASVREAAAEMIRRLGNAAQ